jgi:Mg-chelatase subunit ChlD
LFVFAIDASGSMAANRIARAKSTILKLLRKSYLNRDSVAKRTIASATRFVSLLQRIRSNFVNESRARVPG